MQSSPEPAAGPSPSQAWYVYLVRAENGALYCGITTDPQRRFKQHQNGKGARFFNSSPAVDMVYVEECVDKGRALKRELEIKRMKKMDKEKLAEKKGCNTCVTTLLI